MILPPSKSFLVLAAAVVLFLGPSFSDTNRVAADQTDSASTSPSGPSQPPDLPNSPGDAEAPTTKRLPETVEVVPKRWNLRNTSHQEYLDGAADVNAKLKPSDRVELAAAPEYFTGSRDVWVWVIGQPTTLIFPKTDRISNAMEMSGWTPSEDERAALEQMARIDWIDTARPFVSLDVTSKAQVRALASLDFVYFLELPWDQGATL